MRRARTLLVIVWVVVIIYFEGYRFGFWVSVGYRFRGFVVFCFLGVLFVFYLFDFYSCFVSGWISWYVFLFYMYGKGV